VERAVLTPSGSLLAAGAAPEMDAQPPR
jgi:hypothetical protein